MNACLRQARCLRYMERRGGRDDGGVDALGERRFQIGVGAGGGVTLGDGLARRARLDERDARAAGGEKAAQMPLADRAGADDDDAMWTWLVCGITHGQNRTGFWRLAQSFAAAGALP